MPAARSKRSGSGPSSSIPHVARRLAQAKPGTITDPVRTAEGYTIIKVYETRAIGGKTRRTPEEKPQRYRSLPQGNIAEAQARRRYQGSRRPAADRRRRGQASGHLRGKRHRRRRQAGGFQHRRRFPASRWCRNCRPPLRIIAENLKVGDISTPFASNEGIRLYMLCDKKEVDAKPVDRDRVYRRCWSSRRWNSKRRNTCANLRRETLPSMFPPAELAMKNSSLTAMMLAASAGISAPARRADARRPCPPRRRRQSAASSARQHRRTGSDCQRHAPGGHGANAGAARRRLAGRTDPPPRRKRCAQRTAAGDICSVCKTLS